MIQHQEFQIKGMGCQHCAQKITQAIQALDGVDEAAVNYEEAFLAVSYNPTVTAESSLFDTVQDLGYQLEKLGD
ncbi:heavy-metal-associated domain-containing protein [Hutsoniella sourekii]